MKAITEAIREASPRYFEDSEYGRIWNFSKYIAERHWPEALVIDGKSYRRRTRRRRR